MTYKPLLGACGHNIKNYDDTKDYSFFYPSEDDTDEWDSVMSDHAEYAEDVKFDLVQNPKHYCSHPSGVEVIQITEHESFCVGNAIKYLLRHTKKNGKQDLEKALWYVNREIARVYGDE